MVRVKENIEREREVQVGSLEQQSRWGEWRELVLKTDMSWHTLFNYGDSLVWFMLSAVYGTLLTPSLVAKWSEEEDGKCKLCEEKIGTIPHILAGCRVALTQGRYRWRHDKVLRQISEQVAFHCNRRVNSSKNKMDRGVQGVEFIPAGKRRPVAECRKENEFDSQSRCC